MKKKVIITTIAAFLFILFSVGAIIFTIGKTANTQTNIQLSFMNLYPQKKKERLPFVPFLLLAACVIIFGKLLLLG